MRRDRAGFGGAAACLLLCLLGQAGAQPVYGRIPDIELGIGGAIISVPVKYVSATGRNTSGDDSSQSVGLALRLHADLGRAVVYGDGFGNGGLIGDLRWMGRVGVVLGWRDHIKLLEFIGWQVRNGRVAEAYRIRQGKKLPVVYGLLAGVSAFHMGEASLDYGAGGSRDAELVLAGDVGLGLITAQFELMLAPKMAFEGGAKGLYWSLKYAVPIGSRALFVRMSGDHFFGDGGDKRFEAVLLASLGVSSSLGLSAGD